ncbi:MAG: c-type cytochrome [Kiritimatiellae bacterium]|nr:c-type cytochrome [Kiritimatiellia bacterium]
MTRRVLWSTVGACVVLVLVAAALVAWYRQAQRQAAAAEAARLEAEAAAAREALYRQFGIDAPGTRLFVPLPPELPYHQGRAKLGRALFNDRRLTRSQISQGLVCGACHHLGAGGTDSKVHHGVLTRSVYNAAFATSYLHDGSLPDLHAAVGKMIEDPHFCWGGPLAGVAARLAQDANLAKRFQVVYTDGLTGTNVVDAVVEYLKTLVTDGTPYDFWCAGHVDRLTAEQRRGSEVYLAAGCMDCHDGPVLGSRKVVRGRKVPALRGLGLRKAYLTEGKVKDLDAVVPMMPGGDLSPEDRKALVAFLKAL